MAISNGLLLPTSENPRRFFIWFVFAKLVLNQRLLQGYYINIKSNTEKMNITALNNLTPYFLFIILIIFSSCENTNKKETSNLDEIRNMMQEYRQAWKNGDSASVLNKLSDDIILFLPGKTGKPIITKNNVSEFWFPKSDIKYPIIQYEVKNEDVESSGDMAYYQGLSKLTWCTIENGIARDTIQSISEFTNILKKEGRKWKIYRIMYNLKDSNYTR